MLERRLAALREEACESESVFSRDNDFCPNQSMESESSILMKEYLEEKRQQKEEEKGMNDRQEAIEVQEMNNEIAKKFARDLENSLPLGPAFGKSKL